jgi:autotransporter-associated beta strand protein
MHDPQYRCAIAWQNTGYNQPPHPGFFVGQDMFPPPLPPISSADLVWRGGGGNVWDTSTLNWFTNSVWVSNNTAVAFSASRSVLFDLSGSNNSAITLTEALAPAQVIVHSAKDYVITGAGQLSGAMKLTKAGPVRLTINNTNTYTGGTFVSGGALFVNGALDASPVTVERRGTPEGPSQFGGAGRLGAGLTVQAGCVVIVGPGTSSPGTLTVSNNLTELSVLNRFDLSNDPTGTVKTNDAIQIYGNLTLSGTNTIEINQLDGALGGGLYPLFKYSGTLSGGLANLALSGSFIQGVALTNPPGMIGLLASVPGAPPAAPSGLVATAAGAFQINLSWTDNSETKMRFLLSAHLMDSHSRRLPSIRRTTRHIRTRDFRQARRTITGCAGPTLQAPPDFPTPTALRQHRPRLPLPGEVMALEISGDVAGALNWYDGANLVVYNNGSDVFFDQSGSNNTAVTLVGALQPDSVTVNATKNYTFNTTNGFLGGAPALTKSGSGTLTINNSNSFSGGVNLNSGNLTLGNTFGAGSGPIRFNGGTVSFVVGSQQTYANALVINSNSTILSQGGNNNIVSGSWSGSNAALNIAISSTGTFTVAAI